MRARRHRGRECKDAVRTVKALTNLITLSLYIERGREGWFFMTRRRDVPSTFLVMRRTVCMISTAVEWSAWLFFPDHCASSPGTNAINAPYDDFCKVTSDLKKEKGKKKKKPFLLHSTQPHYSYFDSVRGKRARRCLLRRGSSSFELAGSTKQLESMKPPFSLVEHLVAD